jgi:hypothetical protein
VNTIEIQYDIARNPNDVFAFLIDFSQLKTWRTLEDFRVEPSGPIQLGSKLFSKVSGIGQPMRMKSWSLILSDMFTMIDAWREHSLFRVAAGQAK